MGNVGKRAEMFGKWKSKPQNRMPVGWSNTYVLSSYICFEFHMLRG